MSIKATVVIVLQKRTLLTKRKPWIQDGVAEPIEKFMSVEVFCQFSNCIIDLSFPFRPSSTFRQSEIVACSQGTMGENGSLKL